MKKQGRICYEVTCRCHSDFGGRVVVVWLGNMMLTLASFHRSVAIGSKGEAGLSQAYETRTMTAG